MSKRFVLRVFVAVVVGGLMGRTSARAAGSEPPVQSTDARARLSAAPKIKIGNGLVKAVVLKPDPVRGFYRATRFDWSGVVSSVVYRGQEYYGLWFDQTAPNVRDFVLHDGELVAGPNTAVMGPAEAFDPNDPPGFKEAAAGGPFLKIGVGLLKKPDDGAAYSSFRLYDILDGGDWKTEARRDRVTSTHTLSDPASGWGYVYLKTVRLVPGKPQMVIDHSLRNTGSKSITTSMFNHNFLTLGGEPTQAGLALHTPYALSTPQPIHSDAVRIEGQKLVYTRALIDGQTASTALGGFGPTAADHSFSLMNPAGAGYSVNSDRPLQSLYFWSIRRTVAAEPYVGLTVAPGETVRWATTYTYAAP